MRPWMTSRGLTRALPRNREAPKPTITMPRPRPTMTRRFARFSWLMVLSFMTTIW